ncbi:MAG: hypothetical protein RLZZ157_88 [Pseudomonadota bacterium]|jgi:hypothetical protein
MTARASSTLARADAPHISNREAYARTRNFVLRTWDGGLPEFFADDIYRLIFEWHADMRRSWKDWADAQVKKAHPLNQHPPKLRVGNREAPLWMNQYDRPAFWVPTLEIHAGDWELATHAILHGDGTTANLERCRDALNRARD